MKRSYVMSLLACGVMAWSVSAYAQTWRQDPYYGGYGDGPYSQSRAYGYGGDPQYLIGRVMSDLNQAARRARLDGHEVHHFEEVAGNLQDFQARWARGKFDNGKLDKAIHNLEHLAEADRVRGRDRDVLTRDLYDLRQFRAAYRR